MIKLCIPGKGGLEMKNNLSIIRPVYTVIALSKMGISDKEDKI
jgi:hypothetical protein